MQNNGIFRSIWHNIKNFLKRFQFITSIYVAKKLQFQKTVQWVEKRKCFGKLYPDKTFYVIRVRPSPSSIISLVVWVCIQLKICEENGYIPVVDFSFYKNVGLETNEVGKVNPWEYYFEQPTMYSTKAVYHAANVIIGNADLQRPDYDAWINDINILRENCRIYEKYIHINKRIEKKARNIYTNLIGTEWRTLGCTYRGTDYRHRKAVDEYKQPTMEELIRKAQELMDEWLCDHIFLSTEDMGAVEEFKKVFEDKLVYVERMRYPSDVAVTVTYKFDREQDLYYKGEEYLIDTYILAHCNCLLSSRVGGLFPALFMNNLRYENKYIYDLGVYTEADCAE